MKSILLKLDDNLFAETEERVKEGKTSRSNYIKAAIEHYNAWQKQKTLAEQVAREVALLKEFDPDEELKRDFETASLEDLKRYLND